jgi:hypothetical protein
MAITIYGWSTSSCASKARRDVRLPGLNCEAEAEGQVGGGLALAQVPPRPAAPSYGDPAGATWHAAGLGSGVARRRA